MTQLTLLLPDDIQIYIDEQLTDGGYETVEDLVIQLLIDARSRVKPFEPLLFLEAASDLIGCVEGPGDLSTNPKYMEGFGQ